MTPLPPGYEWLSEEAHPRVLVEALELYGTLEAPGPLADNPVILGWARQLGIPDYNHDAIPWCGLFMAWVVTKAEYPFPHEPLRALNWSTWGHKVETAMLGDVLTFERVGGGHVGIYVGEDPVCYHILAGNQHDQVSISRIRRGRMTASRRSPWKLGQPMNVRVVKLSVHGAQISTNEK